MSLPFNSPELAELAFYRAFEARDADAMATIWDEADDILCVHPMSGPLNGREAVLTSWREIFSSDAVMRVSLELVQIYALESLVVHIVIEHLEVLGGKRVAPMLATNIYRQSAQGWRMLSHHASPMPGSGSGQTHPSLH